MKCVLCGVNRGEWTQTTRYNLIGSNTGDQILKAWKCNACGYVKPINEV